ncbi:uncharacterized protein LOC144453060 [Glandiceps talaboti]
MSEAGRKRPKRKSHHKRAGDSQKTEGRDDLLRKLTNVGDRLNEVDQKLREQMTSQELRDLKLVFDTFDREKKGFIDSQDLRRAMRILGFRLSSKELEDMIADLDSSNKGLVTFNDFVEFIVNKQGNARDIYDEIVQAFKMLDKDRKDRVTFEDIRNACEEQGLWFSDVMIQEMIYEADKNGDGVVDKEEFINIMLQTNLF